MNAGSGSAVESTRHRASVSRGNRGESRRRECKAASLADLEAAEGSGDGSLSGSLMGGLRLA